ncbi:methyltransferase [Pseudocolwellia agarivorans]|uniref:methyltransferase n=1 Tax=Pseudocolwellia agarivorans TaxID=1911682 RepID=UPI0009843BB4|nr:methyltransferase [Pseudocolwellia agarivorans]
MISPFIFNDKNLFLDRFPVGQVNRSLQAWDAADEYLINYLNDNNLTDSSKNILVFNDAFGALTCNLSDHHVFCVNDSYISQQGIKLNVEQNYITHENITYLTSTDDLPDNIDLILYKIPKSKSFLIDQLMQINAKYSENTVFIAADRAKEIHSSTLKLFEKHLGETTTSLAVKKARLVFTHIENKTNVASPFPTCWEMPSIQEQGKIFSISNRSNVYSREKLDIGARYFINNLPTVSAGSTVIDLGCGNGVVGLSVLDQQPQAEIHFYDESFMAIKSAEENIKTNFPDLAEKCTFNINDCLSSVEGGSVDLILCNPPFHQQTATTDHIAWQMFKDSHRVLKKGGELRIIGNRQLAYHIKLQRIFGNEKLIASNDKFVTTAAIKR